MGVAGDIGAGKTLVMTKFLYDHYLMGQRVISNYGLRFPHDMLTFEELREQVKTKVTLKDVAIGLDELHMWIDSRVAASQGNRILSYFLLQTGKLDVTLYYTTQHFGQVDIRLRQRTDIAIDVSRQGVQHMLQIVNMTTGKRLRVALNGPSFWDLYDTKEVIAMPDFGGKKPATE